MAALTFALLSLVASPTLSLSPLRPSSTDPQEKATIPLASAAEAVDAACSWLVRHQEKDGHWSASGPLGDQGGSGEEATSDDDFWRSALEPRSGSAAEPLDVVAPTDALGDPQRDIGVTALALHALMADGNTLVSGGYSGELVRGLDWLTGRQDPASGLVGKAEGFTFHYGHALATYVLAEALNGAGGGHLAEEVLLRYSKTLKRAVQYIEGARNPYGAWRYSSPPDGDSDTSITAWMTLALLEAEQAGCDVSRDARSGADQWFQEMTDLETGRIGYTERGSPSARVPGVNEDAPQEGAETLTAGALLARLRMGAKPRQDASVVANVKLMLAALKSTSQDRVQDAIWIYWGTAAMAEIGSLPWDEWTLLATPILMQTQEREGLFDGSWDPQGVWGFALGRTGTTALNACALSTIERVHSASLVDTIAVNASGARPVDENIKLGLAWLTAHQDPEGSWDADQFMVHDPEDDRTDGAGERGHDIGVTGLTLLAYLGDGQTPDKGEHRGSVARGLEWLLAQQDLDSGIIGEEVGIGFLYNHAIATLALTEALVLTEDETLRAPAQQAIFYILRTRNPYGVWRYTSPPNGENDLSVTAWMMQALRSAKDAGLKTDPEAWTAARQWIDEMTDTSTGRVGYTERGSPSSRVPGMNDWHRTDAYEAMTAAALYTRFLSGDLSPDLGVEWQSVLPSANLVVATTESLRDSEIPRDLYALYFGSRAMYSMGGTHWGRWSGALRDAIQGSQRQTGAARGSWDPDGPWGYSGGRVYSTSMMVLNALMLKRDDH